MWNNKQHTELSESVMEHEQKKERNGKKLDSFLLIAASNKNTR